MQALVFIAGDAERLERFLALSGIEPAAIREAAQEPGFLLGVLEHVLSDERLTLAFAADAGIAPDQVGAARATLSSERAE